MIVRAPDQPVSTAIPVGPVFPRWGNSVSSWARWPSSWECSARAAGTPSGPHPSFPSPWTRTSIGGRAVWRRRGPPDRSRRSEGGTPRSIPTAASWSDTDRWGESSTSSFGSAAPESPSSISTSTRCAGWPQKVTRHYTETSLRPSSPGPSPSRGVGCFETPGDIPPISRLTA